MKLICILSLLTAWSVPARGIYPEGILNGPPTLFIGFKIKF